MVSTQFGDKSFPDVDHIKKGNQNDNGTVDNPDKIISMKVLADIQK